MVDFPYTQLICRVLALMLVGLMGCKAPVQRQSQALLAQLDAPAAARRDSAREALDDYLFLAEDLPLIYRSLDQPHPEDSATRTALLYLLRELHRSPETEQFIEEAYPAWPPYLQTEALLTLSQLGTPLASELLLGHLAQASNLPQPEALWAPYYVHPERIGALYPALLSLQDQPGYPGHVWGLLRVGLENGDPRPQQLRSHLPRLLTAQDWPEAAERDRLCALSFFAAQPEVNQLLTDRMQQGPPAQRMAVALACLDRGIQVGDSVWRGVAAEPRVRNELLTALEQRGREDLFPARWHTQQALAEGDLAAWLKQRDLDFSQLERLRSYMTDPEGERLWVFRFQYQGYWRLGVSGPQPADRTQGRTAGYLTGSALKPYFGYGQQKRVEAWLAAQGAVHCTLRN